MASLLLALVYLSFVSLGLPDSLLGSSWPTIQPELGVPIGCAGIISAIVTATTITSTLFTNFLVKKLGSGLITAISVLVTAVAMFGFSTSTQFWHIVLWAIPYGFGAGAVDATLNNYAALNFSSKHMNWLHAFWGVGATISPYIMGASLQTQFGWRGGYQTVSLIQIVLTVILFASLPLWKKSASQEEQKCDVTLAQALKTKGIFLVLVMFFCYCAIETTTGLWASSYLVGYRKVDEQTAATLASLFYLGIMLGRFVCGFFSNKLGDNKLIVIGCVIIAFGVVCVALPFDFHYVCYVGLVLVGLGCAPIYPAIIHSTPKNFGEQNSQAIIGLQMAFAYAGSMLMPPLFGAISSQLMGVFPYYLAFFLILMATMFALLYKVLKNKGELQCNNI